MMNNIYDLTGLLPMNTFPWNDVIIGISKSKKKASVFYGVTQNNLGLSPEESTWVSALATAEPLKGLDILLTQPRDSSKWNQAWFQLGQGEFWEPSDNMKHFSSLQQWIASAGVFQETGRQIVFIQMQASATPLHTDQDPLRAPEGFRSTPEFIWITSSRVGKQLIVDGVKAPSVCWFNSYVPHETQAADGLRWSLRIDGKFTDEFKNKLEQL